MEVQEVQVEMEVREKPQAILAGMQAEVEAEAVELEQVARYLQQEEAVSAEKADVMLLMIMMGGGGQVVQAVRAVRVVVRFLADRVRLELSEQ